MTLTKGEGERVIYGMYGLMLVAGVFQLYNIAILLLILTVGYSQYNENKY